jgi:hypothetical protein
LFGKNIRGSSVLGFKLEMKSRLFPKTCFDEPLPDGRCDLDELRLGKRCIPITFKTDPAKTVTDVEEIVLAIGHSPAVYLKAHGLGGHTSRICLITAGINCIFVFGIKSQFDSKESDERVCAHLSITPFIVYAERWRSAARHKGIIHTAGR